MKCTSCENANPENASFCGKCGKNLQRYKYYTESLPGSYPYTPFMIQPQNIQQLAEPRKIANIAKPLPIRLLIVSTIATLAVLVALSLTGSDWADRAMHQAIGAISIAALLLLFAGVRISLGMLNEANKKSAVQSIGSGLVIMLLFVDSGLAFLAQDPLHIAQAQYLEGQQQWQQAITQYQKGGEGPPSSADIALTYDKWGEALNQSGHYTDAIDKFNVVLTNYTTPDEVTRAQKGGATAYYNLAQSELNAQQYKDAVSNFKTLQSRFPESLEAQKTHGPLATALLGLGRQQQRSNACVSAIPTYQDLAANYSDTPEGKDAANELGQPQVVTGSFTATLPTNVRLNAVLVQNFRGTLSTDQKFALVDESPTTQINADGTFAFQPVEQGEYGLVWTINRPDGSEGLYWYYQVADPTQSPDITADVGSLCPFDFGNITRPLEFSF